MKIKGYTLHGDYYLADEVVTNVTWKKACKMKEVITLPNGKKIIARTSSKEELETIPENERGNGSKWYWTSTPYGDNFAWHVNSYGDFYADNITHITTYGGARLGFHRNEIKHLLDVE